MPNEIDFSDLEATSGVDPDFSDLEVKPSEAGEPLSQELTQKKAADRAAGIASMPKLNIVGRAMQAIPQTRPVMAMFGYDPQAEAFARGALSTTTAGLSEAVGERFAPGEQFDPNSPILKHPYAFSTGEVAGVAMPAGELGSVATGGKTALPTGRQILNVGLAGARMGGIFGAASGVAESLQKRQDDPSEILWNIAKRGIPGTMLGFALGAGGAKLGMMQQQQKTQEYGRILRAAVAPKNPRIADKIERDFQKSAPDVFHVNPMADIEAKEAGLMPMEGFRKSVQKTMENIGKELDQITATQAPISGDVVASKLNSMADEMERSIGGPGTQEQVELLRGQAQRWAGKIMSISDAMTATRESNRVLQPIYQKTLQMQNKAMSEGEIKINNVIAKELGGAIDESIGKLTEGTGAGIRQRYGYLKGLDDELGKKINQIINKGLDNPEVANVLAEALISHQGAAGLFALMEGHSTGGVSLLTSAAGKAWLKSARKELKNPNAKIEKLYSMMRRDSAALDKAKNVVRRAVASPPVTSEDEMARVALEMENQARNMQIARSIRGESLPRQASTPPPTETPAYLQATTPSQVTTQEALKEQIRTQKPSAVNVVPEVPPAAEIPKARMDVIRRENEKYQNAMSQASYEERMMKEARHQMLRNKIMEGVDISPEMAVNASFKIGSLIEKEIPRMFNKQAANDNLIRNLTSQLLDNPNIANNLKRGEMPSNSQLRNIIKETISEGKFKGKMSPAEQLELLDKRLQQIEQSKGFQYQY